MIWYKKDLHYHGIICEEGEILPQHVTNYYFEDKNDKIVCFSVLHVQWDDKMAIDEPKMDVYLCGRFDGGLQKIHKKVIAWKFDLSYIQMMICVLSKDKHWIELQKPLKKLEAVCRKVLVAVYWLHFIKGNPAESGDSVWNHLSKTFCAYEVGPFDKDLLDFLPFIKEAAKWDKDLGTSMYFRTFSMKSRADIAFAEDVRMIKKSNFIANEDEIDAGDDVQDDAEKSDDIFDTVCAICDEGGQILCGHMQAIDNFQCQNYLYKQHQCFACGGLGSSAKSSGQEVFCCCSAFCGHFYHPGCVTKFLHFGNETQAKELKQKIFGGELFTFPSHKCFVCKQAEDKDTFELQFAVCICCPRVYHRKCLPKKHKINRLLGTPVRDHLIFPNDKHEEKKCTAEPLSSQRKILASSKRIRTSKSFAIEKLVVKKLKLVTKPCNFVGMSDSTKQAKKISQKGYNELSKKSHIFHVDKKSLEGNSCSLFSKRFSENENKLLPGKYSLGKSVSYPCEVKQENIVGGETKNIVSNKLLTKEANVARPHSVNDNVAQRIKALVDEVHSSFNIDEFKKRHRVPPTVGCSKDVLKSFTLGLIEGSVMAVRTASNMLESNCSIDDIKSVCGPEILNKIFKWRRMLKIYPAPILHGNRYTSFGRHFTQLGKLKEIVNRLHHYVLDGDMVVDFCCGSNDFSFLMKEKLEETRKSCSFKNYDLLPAKIMGPNPPVGVNASLANAFIKKALTFRPKLLILIVPKETKREAAYDLIWADDVLLAGKAFCLLGLVDLNNEQLNDWNINPPTLSLWSCADYTQRHMIIASDNGHISEAQYNINNLTGLNGCNNVYRDMHVDGGMSGRFNGGGMLSGLDGHVWQNTSNLHVGCGRSNGFDDHSCQSTSDFHVVGGMPSGFDGCGWQNTGILSVGGGMSSGFDGHGWHNTGKLNVGGGKSSGFDGRCWQNTGNFSNQVGHEDWEGEYLKHLSGRLNETPYYGRNQNESLPLENNNGFQSFEAASAGDVCIDMELESPTHEIGTVQGKD